MTEESSNDTITTNENDVVSGRGSGANRHKGNLVFRQLIKKNKAYYLSLGKNLKMGVARAIFDEIASKNPPGRFLQKNPETDRWFEVKKERALEKISQALREKPSVKKADHPSLPVPSLEVQQNVNYASQDSHSNMPQGLSGQRSDPYQQQSMGMPSLGMGDSSASRMMEQHQSRTQGYGNLRTQMYEGMRGRGGGSHLGVSPMDMYEMNQNPRMQRMQVMDMNGMNMSVNIPQQGPMFSTFQQQMAYPSSSFGIGATNRMAGNMIALQSQQAMQNQQAWGVDMTPMPSIPDVPQEFLRGSQRLTPMGGSETLLGRPSHSPHAGKDPYVLGDRNTRVTMDRQFQQHQNMMSAAIPATPLQNYRGRPDLNDTRDPLNASNDTSKRSGPSPTSHSFVVVPPRGRKRGHHFSDSITNPDQEAIDTTAASTSTKRLRTGSEINASPPGITVDTDLDRLKTVDGTGTPPPPKLVSPQHEDENKSLSSQSPGSQRDDKEGNQTGLATLSTAASLMSKQ